jgi:transposase
MVAVQPTANNEVDRRRRVDLHRVVRVAHTDSGLPDQIEHLAPMHPRASGLANAGHLAQRIRHWLRLRGIKPVIPPKRRSGKRKRGRPVTYDRVQYRRRSTIEQCVGWLKECRAVATRYEKLALNYLGLVKLAFIARSLRLLTRAAVTT